MASTTTDNVITQKLNPPVIEGTLPAFYQEDDGTAILAVPFALNRAVSAVSIKGFVAKIKTIQSNTFLADLTSESPATSLNNKVATFVLSAGILSRMMVGQHFKVQLAFVGENGTGYFSTVGIVKYTSKPSVTIANAAAEGSEIPHFKVKYTGVYYQDQDVTEKVYKYIFNLYDAKRNLVQTSDWQLHDSSALASDNTLNTLKSSTDSYAFLSNLIPYKAYYVEYGVQTNNGLEIYSPQYIVMELEGVSCDLLAQLNATNVFEEGYVKLTLTPAEGQVATKGTYRLLRASADDNYLYWQEIGRIVFFQADLLIAWEFRDYTIEQGKHYKYALQQYNDAGMYSAKLMSNIVISDFEDMFLFDGQRQLKIRFNPKVTSFKIDRLEQKIDTIGSKYPFFFKNGRVEYKEFPIAGLISYLGDENSLFTTKEKLGLKLVEQSKRHRTPVSSFYESDYPVPTNLLKGYNYHAERLFKLDVLEWLGNGKPKLFKSPSEGNYIVRLMNVSLSPEDKVSRLIHTFSCTAYEIAPVDYNSLEQLGFLNLSEPDKFYYAYETIKLVDDYGNFLHGKINRHTIQGLAFIDGMLPGSFVLSGNEGLEDNHKEKYVIGQNGSLHINTGEEPLPDLYISSETDEQGKYLYNFQGQVTYRYLTKVANKFNLIKEVRVLNEIKTHCGTQQIDLISEYARNVKKELFMFYSLQFTKKRTVNIYGNGMRYFLDDKCTIPIGKFEKDCVYHCYITDNGETTECDQLTTDGLHLDGPTTIRYSIFINGEEFKEVPMLNLPADTYESVIFDNGFCCTAATQIKLVTYEIETTNERLLAIADKDSPEYLALLSQLLEQLKRDMEEGE